MLPDWLAEAFDQAARNWAALPVGARPVYVPPAYVPPAPEEDDSVDL